MLITLVTIIIIIIIIVVVAVVVVKIIMQTSKSKAIPVTGLLRPIGHRLCPIPQKHFFFCFWYLFL
jgi:hypothetical protein